MITLTSGAPSATRGDHRASPTGKTRLPILLAGVTPKGVKLATLSALAGPASRTGYPTVHREPSGAQRPKGTIVQGRTIDYRAYHLPRM